MNDPQFNEWLTRYADVLQLEGANGLARERTLLVHGVICTFVHPCGELQDVAAALIDAGQASSAADRDTAERALSRNLENFLLGAPMFFVNPSSQRLVMGQKFEFTKLEPAVFAPLLDAMALQAKAWQRQGGASR